VIAVREIHTARSEFTIARAGDVDVTPLRVILSRTRVAIDTQSTPLCGCTGTISRRATWLAHVLRLAPFRRDPRQSRRIAMLVRTLVRWSARTLVLIGSASFAVAGVHIVDTAGQGNFTTIQAAVDASIDGDVILVRGGSYAAFTIDNKSLAIYADADATVAVNGAVQILNIAATKTVVLSSLQVTGTSTNPAPTAALSLTDNAGALRFQKCTFTGGAGLSSFDHFNDTYPPAAHGVRMANNPNVCFVGCTLRGGNAYVDASHCDECTGGLGGDGVRAQGSIVALYDSLCAGGSGGETGDFGGSGGVGYRALDVGGFASRSTFKGGDGGDAWDYIAAFGGHGGDALRLEQSAGFHLLSAAYQPGAGGESYFFPQAHGAPGVAISGTGSAVTLPGIARVFSATTLADDGGSISVTVFGQEGDKVYLPQSLRTSFTYKGAFSGVWLVPHPLYFALDPIAIVPASGSVTFDVSMLHLPSNVDAGVAFAQGYVVDTQGTHILGSPIDALLMRCAVLAPDCNGNGRFDTCDLFQHLSLDCDANSVPDECEPDCNHNGVADVCDIASHASADADHNGVPDECEQVGATWYVDASAAPGGDGSSAHPFQSIAQGIAVSLTGHTVIVRDGVYTGAANRNIDFTGRNIVLVSQNGPANCIIDCQQSGRAIRLHSVEGPAARIEGFTIRNGTSAGSSADPSSGGGINLWNASPTIVNCIFSNCVASPDGGGAVYSFSGSPLIRDCSFVGNQAGFAGAVELTYGNPHVVNCLFANNSADGGGALGLFSPDAPMQLVVGCTFLDNTAATTGGAVYYTGNASAVVSFDGCLIAGNSAQIGGGFAGNAHLSITNSTIVNNHASVRGGGIVRQITGSGSIANSIVWGNTAPSGAQIAVYDSGSSLSVSRCDCQGGQAAAYVGAGASLTWGAGNLDLDPRFVDPNGPDADPLTVADNDYRLTILSPCIDAGDNALVAEDSGDVDSDNDTSETLPFDLDHLPRFRDIPSAPDTGSGTPPIVDMGAYERQS
jgi:hypothetical protein